MISDFILEDGTYYGAISSLSGVWADGLTLEACRDQLKEVLEDWLLLKLKDGDDIPGLTDDHPAAKAGGADVRPVRYV